MRKKLSSASKKVISLKKKNEESRVFLEKNSVQTEHEFDSFFIRAKTEVQIKENQIRKDVTLKYENEEKIIQKSIVKILQAESVLNDLNTQIIAIRKNLEDRCLNIR